MTKIFIDRKANVARVVEEIISSEDASVVLVIPTQSVIAESAENFILVKREAEAASKELFVESVDEATLRHAEASGIETIHPLLTAKSDVRRSLTDIVPQSEQGKKTVSGKSAKMPKLNVMKSSKKLTVPVEEEVSDKEDVVIEKPSEDKKAFIEQDSEDNGAPLARKSYRNIAMVLGACAVVFLGVWGVGRVFGSATAILDFKKTEWQFDDAMSATKTATKYDSALKVLPAEVFTESRNLTQLFPASNHANVSTKAKGKILVFNAYSSSPQALVATTRFVTPDGKVFRLDNQITVPGAGIKDGKITPASIEAWVTAELPGVAYNVGPVDKLTIPGFKGTPKYEGFYGQLAGKIEGGFVGEKAVPSDDDIKKAKERVTEVLKNSLASNVLRGRADEFEILPDASDFTIVKLTVNPATDEKGNFSIFGEARTRAIAFRKADIRVMLEELATGGNDTLTLQNTTIEYANLKPDFAKGELKLRVKASGTRTARFNPDAFRQMVAGKRIGDARAIIADLPELSSANISLSPFWIGSVPKDPGKVKVTVQ
jgi:hypothetical protein